ncbi:MAG: MFS transporter [Candidatus Thioglobus sp.]|uniref:MFS transporter n=1 Tax=Candidatus Thioglobus sp. TaxID=2026721 RepID=UPI002627A8DD|nr:MFS transporter [Candidatus Thioglobus sp.]MDC9726872.1 MFS transporter [Candidatus Thioglobus sp.]
MTKLERGFALKISLIMATRMLGLFMIFPIFSVYANNYESVTPLMIGVAIGVYGLTQAIFQIPFGYLSDKYGRKPLLIFGLIIFFIGSVIAANATDIFQVVAGRALQGAGAISAVLMAFLADYVSENERPKANAFVGVQIGMAFMLALLLGPIIGHQVGISGLFWLIAALSIVALVVVATLPQATPKKQYKLSVANFKKILTPELIRLDFSVFALHLILTSAFIAIPIFLVDQNILSIQDNWQIYLPVIVLSFLGMIPMIIVATKFQKTKTVFLLAIFLLALSQILFYQSALNYTTFFIILTLFFVAFNALEALLPSLIAKTASSDKRGLAMGFYASSQFLGAFAGGVIGGWIYNTFGLNSVFLFTTFIALIWWLISLSMRTESS